MKMKKFLTFIVAALLVFSGINAQIDGYSFNENDDLSSMDIIEIEKYIDEYNSIEASGNAISPLQFAILVGITNSTVNGTDVDSFDCRTGFMIGGLVAIPITELFAIQTELLFLQMGAGYNENDYGGDESVRGFVADLSGDYKLNYLALPVSAKYYIINGLALEAGPQIGFLLSAKDDYTFNGVSEELDVKDQTKGIDFGMNAGVSYKFGLGLYLRARYYVGLSEFNDLEFPGNESWKNAALQFSAGYFFN
jgi:hypothetical protein